MVFHASWAALQRAMVILGFLIAAKVCLQHIRINQILRQICKDLITIDARHHGSVLSPEQAENALREMMELAADPEG